VEFAHVPTAIGCLSGRIAKEFGRPQPLSIAPHVKGRGGMIVKKLFVNEIVAFVNKLKLNKLGLMARTGGRIRSVKIQFRSIWI